MMVGRRNHLMNTYVGGGRIEREYLLMERCQVKEGQESRGVVRFGKGNRIGSAPDCKRMPRTTVKWRREGIILTNDFASMILLDCYGMKMHDVQLIVADGSG